MDRNVISLSSKYVCGERIGFTATWLNMGLAGMHWSNILSARDFMAYKK